MRMQPAQACPVHALRSQAHCCTCPSDLGSHDKIKTKLLLLNKNMEMATFCIYKTKRLEA